jgi:hypothetical protein
MKKRRSDRAKKAADWVFMDDKPQDIDGFSGGLGNISLWIVNDTNETYILMFPPQSLTPFYRQVHDRIIERDKCNLIVDDVDEEDNDTHTKAALRLLSELKKHYLATTPGYIGSFDAYRVHIEAKAH